jgi:hypothetical protein
MQPSNNAQYDFILKDPQQPQKKLPIPQLPKLVWVIIFATIGLLFLVIVLALVSGGKKTSSDVYLQTLGKGQEIIRVSKIAESLSKDPTTKGMSATTQAVITSTNLQINKYLTSKKIKVPKGTLESYIDNKIDDQLQQASLTNSVEAAYSKYLKAALTDYEDTTSSAYQKVTVANSKNTFSDAYWNASTILGKPQAPAS